DANQTNVTGDGTAVTVGYNAEIYDQSGDFNTSNSTFTASVTGRYLLVAAADVFNITSNATAIEIHIVTSNRTYRAPFFTSGLAMNNYPLQVQVIADMDAGDTAIVQVMVNGEGSKVSDIDGTDALTMTTYFSGALLA